MSQPTITLLFLAFAIISFILEKIPLGLTATIVALGLNLTGVLSVSETFAGYVNSNVILCIGMFVVGQALFEKGMANRIGGSILLALILIGTALVVFLCAKNRGRLTIGGKTLQLFPDGFNSLLFYFICVLWAIVLIACLLFGSGFAYYAMFAAIAVELIGAVYYTVQLKYFLHTAALRSVFLERRVIFCSLAVRS